MLSRAKFALNRDRVPNDTPSTPTGNRSPSVGHHPYSSGMRRSETTDDITPMHPFEALAEPARRRIIDVLASGEHTAGELAAVVGGEFRISRTAVSKHLRILRDAGFVEVRGDFQWRWYRLTHAGIDHLEETVKEIRRKWRLRVGWDDELRRDVDPLATFERPVPRKGPGRAPHRGRRGKQTTAPVASEPDQGWARGS
jgi:DNA-binding transcriptional ArsR family regulator